MYAGQSLQDYSSYTLSADNRTLTFNVGALYNATNYTIDLPANGISDQSGNTLANIFTSNFSTVADPATGNGSVTSYGAQHQHVKLGTGQYAVDAVSQSSGRILDAAWQPDRHRKRPGVRGHGAG